MCRGVSTEGACTCPVGVITEGACTCPVGVITEGACTCAGVSPLRGYPDVVFFAFFSCR